MNFALLWVDGLLVSLLWVATFAAFVAQFGRWKWVGAFFLSLVVGVPLFFLGSFIFAAATTKFLTAFEPNWFGYSISLLIAYLIGASLIMHRARRPAAGMFPAAANWPRLPLLFSLLIAAAVGYMTLLNMDLVIRARCAIESVQVNCRYLAALPAVTSYSQNAAPLYEKAFAQLSADPPSDVKNPPFGNNDAFDPTELATIVYLRRRSDTIDLLHRAAIMPGCRFEQDLSTPNVTLMLADLNQDRAAANLLNLHARIELAHGQVSSAITDANAILQMSRQIGRRPMMISGLVGAGIAAIGYKTLEGVLPAVTNQQELAGLDLENLEPMGQIFQESLRGEEMFGLDLYSNLPPSPDTIAINNQIRTAGLMSPSNPGPLGAFVRVFFLNADGYVQLLDQMQRLAPQPYFQVRHSLEQVGRSKSDGGLLSSILVPSLRKSFETFARVQAGDSCAQVAVVMTRYRLTHGEFPAHLDDLLPGYLQAVPLDPFNGLPLRLAIRNNQWIVYSVGPDRVDDGGVEKKGGAGDVIFSLSTAMPGHLQKSQP